MKGLFYYFDNRFINLLENLMFNYSRYLMIGILAVTSALYAAEKSDVLPVDSMIALRGDFSKQLEGIRSKNPTLYRKVLIYILTTADAQGNVNRAEVAEVIKNALESLKPGPNGLPSKILVDDMSKYFESALTNLQNNNSELYTQAMKDIENKADYLELISSQDAQNIIQNISRSVPTKAPSSTQATPGVPDKVVAIINKWRRHIANNTLTTADFEKDVDSIKVNITNNPHTRKFVTQFTDSIYNQIIKEARENKEAIKSNKPLSANKLENIKAALLIIRSFASASKSLEADELYIRF
jgi:hypothetical protein